MRGMIHLTDEIEAYLAAQIPDEPDILARLRAETAGLGGAAVMQISWPQARFMQVMARLTGARRYLELGTFTGYSTLALALALPEDGEVVALDVSAEWTGIGRRYWQEAGVDGRIDLRLAPASETLGKLIAASESGRFDLCFIDADKTGMPAYLENALELLRPGGLIMADNVLWGGSVADPAETDEDTEAIRAFNAKLRDDDRVDMVMTPIGDGLSLAVKR